jgi:hypothetical protein
MRYLIIILILCTGCASAPPKNTLSMREAAKDGLQMEPSCADHLEYLNAKNLSAEENEKLLNETIEMQFPKICFVPKKQAKAIYLARDVADHYQTCFDNCYALGTGEEIDCKISCEDDAKRYKRREEIIREL